MNTLVDTLKYFVIITGELTLLFLGISTIVALALVYLPQEKTKKWMSGRGLWGNFIGALIGALTPFCACSTIPMTLGFLEAGAPFGSIMSFVIASPLLNPIILTLLVAMMGVRAAAVYFVMVFGASIVFGVVLEKTGGLKQVKNVRLKMTEAGGQNEIPRGFRPRLTRAFLKAWADFRAVLLYLLVGVGIGAAIYGYLPQDFVMKIAGRGTLFSIPIAAAIGVPLYIRAETAIPIGLALLQKGMSIGTVMALIIGGAGMAIPEMTMLASIFKKKLVAAIVGTIFAVAVIGGFVFDMVF